MKAFVIFRDRVSYGRQCVMALAEAGLEPVVVDHGSVYPEAVTWLGQLEKDGIAVIRENGGRHPRDLWKYPEFRAMCGNDRYVVTDPDVIPSDDCPADWPQYLSGVLDQYPAYRKAGLGLRLDRLPVHYARRDQVILWEQKYWDYPLGDGVFYADVDTTLAVHVPLREQYDHTLSAVRTDHPYVADHLSWYEDFDNLPDDIRYYHEHAETGISFWATPGKSVYWKD